MVIRIGGTGPDRLVGTAGEDLLEGRGGNDTLFGRGEQDFLLGGTGNDILNGEGGGDLVAGDGGNDTVNGNDGNDRLLGGDGRDTVNGGAGDDLLRGTGSSFLNDFAFDRVNGGAGADTLVGADGSTDILRGGAGNDSISVNSDEAFGDAGNDTLSTDNSAGRLTGGTGADTFNLHTMTNDGLDQTVITDFSTQDTLSISANDFNFNEEFRGLALFDTLDTNNNGNLDGRDGFTTSSGGTQLAVDVDTDSLTILVGDDSFDFLGVGNISRIDWA